MNQSRFVVKSCSVEDYIESVNNKNFKAKMTRDVNFLNEFLRHENEERELQRSYMLVDTSTGISSAASNTKIFMYFTYLMTVYFDFL